MNGRERPRAFPPSGSPARGRTPVDGRNGSGGFPGSTGMSRAEKFEDEKRRLVQSCFSKRDTDGSSMNFFFFSFLSFPYFSFMPILAFNCLSHDNSENF